MAGIPSFPQFFPLARGNVVDLGGVAMGVCRLPTDPIGTVTATFSGVPAGSEIRVYRADGAALAGVESSAANPSLEWDVYASGANSINRIVIINISYRIKEFSYTPTVGIVTVPVQMDADGWYSNPA